MTRMLEDGRYTSLVGLLEPLKTREMPRATAAKAAQPAANDLTSIRIQSLAGRGMIDPKNLRLREIQELSASILAYIRQQHTP